MPPNGALFYNVPGPGNSLGYGAQVFAGQSVAPFSDPTIPQLIYVGNLNYFNVVSMYGDPNEYYVDQRGNPVINCGPFSYNGCFETFTFVAFTPTRMSNVGTYYIKVISLISNASFSSVYSFQYDPTLIFFFNELIVNYSDPDGDVYDVEVDFTYFYGNLGSNYTTGLTFSGGQTIQSCFQAGGCPNEVQVYGLPSDLVKMFNGMFFYNNVDLNSSGIFQLYISLIKKEPYGIRSANAFIEDDTIDLVLAQDPIYYSTYDGFYTPDIEYPFLIPENFTTFENCGCNADGDCTQFYADANNNDQVNQQNILIGVLLSIIIILLVVLIIIQAYCFGCRCCKCGKVVPSGNKPNEVPLNPGETESLINKQKRTLRTLHALQ